MLWLNQHDWGPGRAGMNAELTAAASRYPNLEVIDWNAEVAAHPDEVYADSIHLTPAGQNAMAALVRQHYDRYVTSLTPTTDRAADHDERRDHPTPRRAGDAAAATAADDDSGFDGRRARDRRRRRVVVSCSRVSVGIRARRGARRDR